jgi:DNA-binding NtrC family response regulator
VNDSRVVSSAGRAEDRRKVILLVDDEIPIQFLVWKMLKTEGFTVLAASSGESALKTCRGYSGSIDLLLTDMEMSQINGVELYQILAAERPGIKAVIMSGDPGNQEQSAIIGLPFLQKPVQVSTMRQVIETALQERRSPD